MLLDDHRLALASSALVLLEWKRDRCQTALVWTFADEEDGRADRVSLRSAEDVLIRLLERRERPRRLHWVGLSHRLLSGKPD